MTIEEILLVAKEKGASDIHISPGNPLMLRIDGTLEPQGTEFLTDVDTENILMTVVPPSAKEDLQNITKKFFRLCFFKGRIFSSKSKYIQTERFICSSTSNPFL